MVDGSDNFSTRYLVNDTCVALNKSLVYGSILGFEGQIAVFNHQGSKNLRDLFPEPPNPKDVPNCSLNGVLGTLPGIIGTMMAHETLKVITNLLVNNKEHASIASVVDEQPPLTHHNIRGQHYYQ